MHTHARVMLSAGPAEAPVGRPLARGPAAGVWYHSMACYAIVQCIIL